MTDTTTNERIVALEKNLNAARMDIANLNTLVDKLTHVDENNLGVVDRILARLDGLEADKRLDKIDHGLGLLADAIEAAATEDVQHQPGPRRLEIARALESVADRVRAVLR
jgi:hypothetical protein